MKHTTTHSNFNTVINCDYKITTKCLNFFLTYGQHFLICDAKQDIFDLVELLFRKISSKTNCQSEVLHNTRQSTYFHNTYLLEQVFLNV